MSYLVTGAAGFIGFHVAQALLKRGEKVVGVDVVNTYYDPKLKEARLAVLARHAAFTACRVNIADGEALRAVFSHHKPRRVVHLAAQAGVRYSVEHPEVYLESNLVGFGHILECCCMQAVEHLLFASTSSVYGSTQDVPFREDRPIGHPLSFYAATKAANESMAHAYAHIRQLPCTGVRFFTVYGPWGRPDMALFKFSQALLRGSPLELYNQGQMKRDFTYIDDVVTAVLKIVDQPARVAIDAAPNAPHISASAPYRLYNIGRGAPVALGDFVATLEKISGRKAQCALLPMQEGDVPITWADVSLLKQDFSYAPITDIGAGVEKFWHWYRDYHGV